MEFSGAYQSGQTVSESSGRSVCLFRALYYLKAEETEIVKATTWYSTTIHASVEKGNIFACQFHPEKSSDVGLQILRNFAAIGKEENGYVYEKNHSMSGCS